MLSFTPCADIFFKDLPFAERLKNLSKLGFSRYEMWTWWDKSIDDVKNAANNEHIQLSACCTKFVSLVDPAERTKYLQGLEETIAFCRAVGCGTIISQVGNERTGVARKEQHDSLVAGLRESAKLLAGTNLQLVIEPLNLLVDHKGYFLSRSDEAAEIVAKVGSDSIKILFDVYHQQITEGNVTENLRKYAGLIGHYHIADVPGRHEPGTGELNYRNILQAIAATGYHGNVGFEFFPATADHTAVLKDVQEKLAVF